MQYSIIIVTHNSVKVLPQCLESIVNSTETSAYEVVIVDNASTDETDKIFRALEGDVKIIRSQYNAGFARAANQGIEASHGEFVVILNPDTMVTPGWLQKMRHHFIDGNTGAVGPLSNYVAGLQKYELYFSGNPGLSPDELSKSLERQYYHRSVETKMLIGFCLMIPRKVLNQAGMLDDDLLLGSEDLELSHRLQMLRFSLKVALDTFIYHVGHTAYQAESESERWNNLSASILKNKLTVNKLTPDPRKIWSMDWFDPKTDDKRDRVSIIIPTFNGLKYTKMCVESIKKHTFHPYEIIVVDNGSSDGTVEYLESTGGIKRIFNRENRGYPAACNQGIEASDSPYVLLLNNDIILTKYWLSRLFQGFFAYPDTGLVGPRSNDSAGYQQIKAPEMKSPQDIDSFAKKIKTIAPRQFREVDYLSGFALLIDRKVIRNVGMLDERFGVGNYEDQDFCKRAVNAGYRLLVANEVFIYHYGSRAFLENKFDYNSILEENRRKFAEKWADMTV